MGPLLRKIFGTRPDVIPTHLSTREDFARFVLQSDVPVIVDVWSETCAPCKQLVPVLIKVATKYEGKLRGGNILIAAHVDNSDEEKRAKEAFAKEGAHDISSTSEASVPRAAAASAASQR